MSARKKQPPPTFTQRHAETISKLKLILIVVCLIAIPVSYVETQRDVGSINNRVTKIEPACLQHGPHSPECHESFGSALESLNEVLTPQEARIIVCRSNMFPAKKACQVVRRREADAKIPQAESPSTQSQLQDPPNSGIGNGNDAESTPSPTGNSQPAPGDGGSHQGGSGGNGGQGSPTPSQPAPTQPSSPSPSSPSSSSNSSSSSSGGEAAPVQTAPPAEEAPVVEPAPDPGVIEEVGTAAGGTLESVGGVVCGVTGALNLPCK